MYAPSGATTSSNFPVYFFIQGGGFTGNLNANYNGGPLIAASGYNIVVVNFNYRVGPYGFLASSEVANGGSLNAGLHDQYKALRWVKKYISQVCSIDSCVALLSLTQWQFGGNASHVVLGGDSAGAASISILLTAFNGADPGLFIGAAAESPTFLTQLTVPQSQQFYNGLVSRTGCTNAANGDTLACLRSLPSQYLQGNNTGGTYGPTIDGAVLPNYTYNQLQAGKFVKLPTIWGDDTNGGATFCPRDNTKTLAASNAFVQASFPALTQNEINEIDSRYPKAEQFAGTDPYYRQCSNVYGDIRYTCPALYAGQSWANYGQSSWVYRYNVLDPTAVAQGYGVPHVVELNAIWGPAGTGGAPPSYTTTNKNIIPEVQAYWISFIKTLNPNTLKLSTSPNWDKWVAGATTWRRLKLQTNVTAMENVDDGVPGQQSNCQYFNSIGPYLGQ